LAVEDAVVLILDLHRRDYHAEKTNHLNPKLAAMMGMAAQSAVPQATEDSYASDDYASDDYASDDVVSDPEETPGPNGGAVANGDAPMNEQEMALLDGKDLAKKPDLKVLAVDSSNGANRAKEDEETKEEPQATAPKKKRVSRHKSSSALKKDRLNYELQEGVLSEEMMNGMEGLNVKESFEVLKVVLAKHEHLFDDLKKFHILNVQKAAKMKIRLSGPLKEETSTSALRDGAGGGSVFARPSAGPRSGKRSSISRSGLMIKPQRRRKNSSSRSGLRPTLDPFKLGAPHHEPTATPIIIQPKDFGDATNLTAQKSDAENLGGWTDEKADEDMVDLNKAADLNNAME